jgi:hypothetical protein
MTDPFKGLGQPRQDRESCSLCETRIPTGHLPLVVFAEGRTLMWVYCPDCEPAIRDAYKAAKREGIE